MKTDPGSDVLDGAPFDRGDLLCGRCGEQVTDRDGCFVDGDGANSCNDADLHTAHTYEVVRPAELARGDRVMLWGEPVIIDDVSEPDDTGWVTLTWLHAAPGDNHTYTSDVSVDELIDKLTSGPLPVTSTVPDGPDPAEFTDAEVSAAERYLDDTYQSGDPGAVQAAKAKLNLMRARRLADLVVAQHPLADKVILEPGSAGLTVWLVVLRDGTALNRGKLRERFGVDTLTAFDREAARLDDDGQDTWGRVCGSSAPGHHEMLVSEARMIDALDLDRGYYDPARFDRR